MSFVELNIIDAFTLESGQGNRAGVVLDANHLTTSQMQNIATAAGYSETAFVLKPEDDTHNVHVRYFTPSAEVPICGHATIATHFIRNNLMELPQTTFFAKTGAGILRIELEEQGAKTQVIMAQANPEFGNKLTPHQCNQLRSALKITPTNQVNGLPVQIVSTGHSKVMVPITSRKKLNRLKPDMKALTKLSGVINCNGFFVFAIEENNDTIETHGRMFAPAIGIDEDPVTGNANGPAGAYLAHYGKLIFEKEFSYFAHQGHAMGKPGTIHVRLNYAENGELSVKIAGNAVKSGSMKIEL